jgi:hypothetical protein
MSFLEEVKNLVKEYEGTSPKLEAVKEDIKRAAISGKRSITYFDEADYDEKCLEYLKLEGFTVKSVDDFSLWCGYYVEISW